MDLAAYGRIDDLSGVVEANGIAVPSLRGYRLMRDEPPADEDTLKKSLNELVGAYWWMESDPYNCSDWYDRTEDDFINGYRPEHVPRSYVWREYVDDGRKGLRVKRVHRTSFFQRLSMLKARHRRQWELWNAYAGREDVLYIHARIGGPIISEDTWHGLRDKEWFIEACDDAFDPTYCDIYARIKVWPGE